MFEDHCGGLTFGGDGHLYYVASRWRDPDADRLFGHCGDGIGRLFGYDPDAGEMTDTGVAASVFNRRRYGYVFGDAVIGRDGEIVFGEDDDLGHVWLYFPRIRGR